MFSVIWFLLTSIRILTVLKEITKLIFFLIFPENPAEKFDEHWKPIFLLCPPCHFNFDIIIKMETFSRYYNQDGNLFQVLLSRWKPFPGIIIKMETFSRYYHKDGNLFQVLLSKWKLFPGIIIKMETFSRYYYQDVNCFQVLLCFFKLNLCFALLFRGSHAISA